MRQIMEVLRLKYGCGLRVRGISRALNIPKSTVWEYLQAAALAHVGWPLPEGLGESELQAQLFPPSEVELEKITTKAKPDCERIHTELKRKGVTRMLLWEEYAAENPAGCIGYTQFCNHYRFWAKKLDVTMRQHHIAGEKMFVDYSGLRIGITDPKSLEVLSAEFFVAVLGASNYTYAEASRSQELDCWIGSHIRTFEFFGGVPAIIVPDNLKSGITKPCRYEPTINRTYEDMAAHYGTAVIPTRIHAPRDKSKVEAAVLIAQRWILAKLRDRVFYSIEEANGAIWELLEEYNTRPMQEVKRSRRAVFDEIERGALLPLPATRYVKAEFKNCLVNIDYHIEVEKHYYSVPHILFGEKVEARYRPMIVEIFHDGKRVASHLRSYQARGYTTSVEHMPKSHQRHAEWTPSRIISWGASKGEAVGLLFEQILMSRRHPEQGYRSCLGIIRMEKKYGAVRLLAACKKALALRAYGSAYRTIKNMLGNKTESIPISEGTGVPASMTRHTNVRGGGYYKDSCLADLDLEIAKGVLQ